MRQIGYLLTTLIVFFILALLPVIPVISSPVVSNPVERLTWVSLWRILFNPKVGVRLQLQWYSLLVIVLLIAAEFFIRRFILQKFFVERDQNAQR
jgi:hypothetical protein